MATIQRKTPLYCDLCGMPPEYCEYGPDYETHCDPWLQKNHPAERIRLKNLSKKKNKNSDDVEDEKEEEEVSRPWTIEERLSAFYTQYQPEKLDGVPGLVEKYEGKYDKLFSALVKKYGPEPEDPYLAANKNMEDDDDMEEDDGEGTNKKKRRGVGAKKVNKVDTRVIIQKISRNKKKAVTIVVGMETVPGIKLKEVSKAFSKRFAGSSSVKDVARGGKEIIIQGDHQDDVAAMIVNKFGVSADSVFLDVDGEFVPFR